jgi:hypothetical protein
MTCYVDNDGGRSKAAVSKQATSGSDDSLKLGQADTGN